MSFQTLDETNLSDTISGNDVVLVDFYADWCMPCKMLMPTVETIATEFEGRAVVGKVDSDANSQLAVEHGVSALPTILIFKGGEVVERLIGLKSEDDLREALNKALA
jgi:thioredoxin 1